MDKDFYLALPKQVPAQILDIGCGTGQLTEAYAAQGHRVTGIDPAAAMVEVARAKPLGRNIAYHVATTRTVDTSERFDLITMTGHAFQTLLTDDDVAQLFGFVAKHLKPDGRLVFESRNPEMDWFAKWGASFSGGRKFVGMSDTKDHKVFEQHYLLRDESLISRSELRFASKSEITSLLRVSGLHVEKLFGSWDREAFSPGRSEEMIFVSSLN